MAAIERVGLARRTIPHQTSTSIVPQLISRLHRPACKLYASAAVQHAQLTLERPLCTSHVAEQNSIVPAPALVTKRLDEGPAGQPIVPLFVSLCDEVCAACHRQPEAVRAGLKALQQLGVWGVVVNVWWSQAEPVAQQYDWTQYQAVFQMAREIGLKVKVAFCFHGDNKHSLPAWVLNHGQECPDIFFTDRSGCRNMECLSVGVDHVPALGGRTALQAYTDLLVAFRDQFCGLLGSVLTDADIGLGPMGELRYPSTPLDSRWNFPGIGEFQCYDRFMVASLSAAAQQVGQPHWGNSGPHDAGSYCQWPHQTGFFHHQGSWSSEYGRFFLQWYSSMLLQHADQFLGRAQRVFKAHGVQLHARLPTIHWWYNQAAHAAELTAGLYNTGARNGYLAFCQVLALQGVSLVLTGAEMRDCEQPSYALASPEALLLHLQATAASQHVRTSFANLSTRFDQDALAELERKAFANSCYRGIDVSPANGLIFNSMGDAMFEPHNWLNFKEWTTRVWEQNAMLAAEQQQLRSSGKPASSSSSSSSTGLPRTAAAAAAVAGKQQPGPSEQHAEQAERQSALV